jgi:hypothetical protein
MHPGQGIELNARFFEENKWMYGSSFLQQASTSDKQQLEREASAPESEPAAHTAAAQNGSSAPTGTPTASQVWREAVLPYLGTRLIVLVIGLLSVYYLLPVLISNPRLPTFSAQGGFPQSLWLMWNRFDSGFYISIARHGYWPASTLYNRSNWVFYPLYPLLIAGVGRLFGGSADAFNIAGVLIANVAGVGMIIYLYLLVYRELGQKIAGRAILYLALFPLAFFLSAIYTESLLLCFSIAAIYYARQQRWWLAGLCGGLAALTRLQGVALVVPLAWEYLRAVSAHYAPIHAPWPARLSERVKFVLYAYFSGLWQAAPRIGHWLRAMALVLIPGGLLIFMLYGQLAIGDFFATFHASRWGWGRQLSSPLRLLVYSLRHPILAQPLDWNFWLLNIIVAFAFLAVILWSLRRLPVIYTLYTAVTVLLPLSSNSLNSLARYYLLIFPAFMLLALFTCKGEKQQLHTFLIAGFAALQSLLLVFFVLGLFAIA